MKDTEREQIKTSTDAQLRDRLKALRERYDPKGDGGCFPGGGYPMAQLRELHLIQDELRSRERERFTDADRPEKFSADNHSALFDATDIEPSMKYGR